MSRVIKAPKKRNAFFSFMQLRRRELELEGKKFPGGWKEVADTVNEEWQNLPLAHRNSYNPNLTPHDPAPNPLSTSIDASVGPARPSNMQLAINIGEVEEIAIRVGREQFYHKPLPSWAKNSVGQLISEVDSKNKEIVYYRMHLEKQVMEHVRNTENIEDVVFTLITVNTWYESENKEYIPSEIALIAFSLREGIIDQYATVVDPASIPLGMMYLSSVTQDKLCLPEPGFAEHYQNYNKILENIFEFKERYSEGNNCGFLFCRRRDIAKTYSCLDWLCRKVGVSKVYDLHIYEYLVLRLAILGMTRCLLLETEIEDEYEMPDDEEEVIQCEEQVNGIIDNFEYACLEYTACLFHMRYKDAVPYCALNILNRYVYHTLEELVSYFNVRPIHGVHIPLLENWSGELKKKQEMLLSWGVVDEQIPGFVTPAKREYEHEMKVALGARHNYTGGADVMPMTHLALMFRPTPNYPEFVSAEPFRPALVIPSNVKMAIPPQPKSCQSSRKRIGLATNTDCATDENYDDDGWTLPNN